MILADKIINERKKNGWSQEELADKLSVSRQSVSKWEGAQSVPDLNRIIEMAKLFNVSLDYLLKDELEPEALAENSVAPVDSGSSVRKLSMEEAVNYLNTIKSNNVTNVISIVLFILCPVTLIFLAGLANSQKFAISESLAAGVGLLVLAIFVAVGIVLSVIVSKKEEPYEFLKTDDFDSEYGVSGMVKEQLKANETKFLVASIISILCFIFCPVGLIGAALAEASDFVIVSMFCLLLIMVAAGVGVMNYFGRIKHSLNTLLDEHKDRNKMKAQRKMGRVNQVYWMLMVAAFLVMGIGFELWKYAGVFWAVAGVLYCVVRAIAKGIIKDEE